MTNRSSKSVFTNGPITPLFISQSIEKHATKKEIGAHVIFLGQVRADEIAGKKVVSIEYSAYEGMAEKVIHAIREETFSKFELTCMHIYHSIGTVKTGEISLFVFTSAPHRKSAQEACNFVVEEIKSKSPVWGKEILEDQTHIWKNNT